MSTRIERWGMELAEAIRREHELSQELEKAKTEIDQIIAKIRTVPDGALYDSTSEMPLVRPYIPSASVEDSAATLRIELPDQTLTAMQSVLRSPGENNWSCPVDN